MSEPKYTSAEKAKAIARELGMRRRVFPRRVELGTMTQSKCDHEIGVFEEIQAEYQARAEREAEAGSLFHESDQI